MERTENTITLIIKVKKTDEAKKTVERLMLEKLQTPTETTATLSKKLFLC